MEWVRLDVDFFSHPRTGVLTTTVQKLYLRALLWSAEHETDWFIPTEMGRQWGNALAIKQLVAAGCWEPVEGGWHIHDAEERQPGLTAVRELREKRAEAGRKGGLATANARANGPANARANAVANGQQPASTVTVTPTKSLVVLETHEDFHSPVDDDDRFRIDPTPVSKALWLLAERDLASREAEKGRVGHRDAWLAAAAARRRVKHAEMLAACRGPSGRWIGLIEGPNASPEALADWLDSPPAPPIVANFAPGSGRLPNWSRGES